SYMTAAEQLAANAVKNAGSLLSCTPTGAGEEACIRQFIERFGKTAYRRPLAADEVTDLFGLYKSIRTVRDATRSVEVTLRAMLQSPHFLYRLELGNTSPGAAVALTPYEIASRLSYAFWGSMPDDALFAAADADHLKTNEQIVQQARRLWASTRSKPVMEQFYVEWLDLDSVPS